MRYKSMMRARVSLITADSLCSQVFEDSSTAEGRKTSWIWLTLKKLALIQRYTSGNCSWLKWAIFMYSVSPPDIIALDFLQTGLPCDGVYFCESLIMSHWWLNVTKQQMDVKLKWISNGTTWTSDCVKVGLSWVNTTICLPRLCHIVCFNNSSVGIWMWSKYFCKEERRIVTGTKSREMFLNCYCAMREQFNKQFTTVYQAQLSL